LYLHPFAKYGREGKVLVVLLLLSAFLFHSNGSYCRHNLDSGAESVLHGHNNGNASNECPYAKSMKYHSWDKVRQTHNLGTSQRRSSRDGSVITPFVLF